MKMKFKAGDKVYCNCRSSTCGITKQLTLKIKTSYGFWGVEENTNIYRKEKLIRLIITDVSQMRF